MAIIIQTVPTADFDQVAAIECSLQEDAWGVESLLAMTHHQEQTGFCVLGAYQSQRLVGYLIYQIVDVAELLRLGVDKAYQGRGIGKLLSDHWLNQLSCDVLLEVRADNAVAIHLYQTLGFKTIHIRKNYYKNTDNSTCHALIMQRVMQKTV